MVTDKQQKFKLISYSRAGESFIAQAQDGTLSVYSRIVKQAKPLNISQAKAELVAFENSFNIVNKEFDSFAELKSFVDLHVEKILVNPKSLPKINI